MGVHVMVVYRPTDGGTDALTAEVEAHVPLLRQLGLATNSPALALRTPDGSVVECFEWASRHAIEAAHSHPEVLAMWERFGSCCEFGTLEGLPNASEMFAEFELMGWY